MKLLGTSLVSVAALTLVGCFSKSPSSSQVLRAPTESSPSKTLQELQAFVLSGASDSFSELSQHSVYRKQLAQWNLRLDWKGTSLGALAYWPLPLGGTRARWQTAFSAFLARNGNDFALHCDESCTSAMSSVRVPSPRIFLSQGGNPDELSAFEKTFLASLATTEEEVRGIVAGARDGTDTRLSFSIPSDGSWWEGYCHILPIVSALFPNEPQEVVHKGIHFYRPDIAAMATDLVEQAHSKFKTSIFGKRFNGTNGEADARDDVNPATMFLVLTNLARGASPGTLLVMDTEPGAQVWNAGVAAFDITIGESLTAEGVKDLYLQEDGRNPMKQKRGVAPGAQSFVRVGFTLKQHTGQQKTLEGIVEMDGDKIVGGEWIGDSASSHPDFLWAIDLDKSVFEAFLDGRSRPADQEAAKIVRAAFAH